MSSNSKKHTVRNRVIFGLAIIAVFLGLIYGLPSLFDHDKEQNQATLADAGNTAELSARSSSENQMVEKTTIGGSGQSISAEKLAKKSGVPEKLEREDGSYQLVAVIEGIAQNKRLTKALGVISTQRQQLQGLYQSRESITTDGGDRSKVDAAIKKYEDILNRNLAFMQKNYSYTINNQYLLVPEESELVSTEPGKEERVVKTFSSYAQYDHFQKERNHYTNRLIELGKAMQQTSKTNAQALGPIKTVPKGRPGYEEMMAKVREMEMRPIVENLDEIKVDRELVEMRHTLMEKYDFDPEKTHQVRFKKSSFYERARD